MPYQIKKDWGNVKPSAGSQIDYGHPLSRGLAGAFLFAEGAGLRTRNSVNPMYDATLPSIATYTWGASPFGHGTGVVYNPTSTNKITLANGFVTGTTFTLACGMYKTNQATTYGAIFVNAAANGGWYARAIATPKQNYFYGGADHLSSSAIILNRPVHLAISVAAGAGTFYMNGLADGTCSSVTSNTLIYTGSSSGTETLTATNMHYLYFWTRALSQNELRKLVLEPYAMFIPPQFRLRAPAVVVAGGFKAAWASQRSKTIGAGVM